MSALNTICPPSYYGTNQLRANPPMTHVCAFHLRNREAKRELNVVWNGTRLSNTTTPVYLCVHLDRTLCYKTHIEKTKMKVNARNNIIRKLANLKWGCKASTLIPSCNELGHSVHLLAGIAPPHNRRTVAYRMERTRQTTHARHQLFHHRPAASRLESLKSLMLTVTPLDSSASSSRLGLEVAESLPAGSGEDWLCW